MEAVMKLLSFILICSQFLGAPVFAAEAPRWGVDWNSALYENTGTDEKPEIAQARIFDGEPALQSDILETLKTLEAPYFRDDAYKIMLDIVPERGRTSGHTYNPKRADANAFNLGGHIIKHFKTYRLAQDGNPFALGRLLTRVAGSQDFSQR